MSFMFTNDVRRRCVRHAVNLISRATKPSVTPLAIYNRTLTPTSAQNLLSTRVLFSTKTSAAASKSDSKPSAWDPFLDNIGKIFFGVIALIIASLVRSSMGTTNRARLLEELENSLVTVLDPLEIDDLRIANDELTPDIFRRVIDRSFASARNGTMTYSAFVIVVRDEMKKIGKGEEFTIQLGHLLDRVVFAALNFFDKEIEHNDKRVNLNVSSERELPVSFLLTVYSLALNCCVDERINILFDVLEREEKARIGGYLPGKSLPEDVVLNIIQYFQLSCQLPPQTQVMPIPDAKYPVQTYRRAGPKDMIEKYREGNGSSDTSGYNLEDFRKIICSPEVCAW
eukprot:CAMPEP_0116058536 /NCGR_PEP_ID=MMETSP0322-20121206/5253_1 /TAXON_ID=163516 /ORGANISM="Leptocylindrus danicus var. apora, Strain B651" /LENGTH=340 /DNA_ID=CAMNT_0003542733 /DNA_START=169 /DNA_END=1188 /DNA_ORIENTATION=+